MEFIYGSTSPKRNLVEFLDILDNCLLLFLFFSTFSDCKMKSFARHIETGGEKGGGGSSFYMSVIIS